MNFKKLPYFFNKALLNIKHSLLINIVTITTISIAILIFSSFIMVVYNLGNLISRFEDKVHIVAYLKDEHVDDYERIKANIEKMEGVKTVGYRSKEDALADFKTGLGKNDKFLDDIPVNPLPASFEIRLEKGFKAKSRINDINGMLKETGFFDDTAYGQEWIENFQKLLDILKVIGLAVAGGFLLAAVFIISNTIRLTLYARREEIEILKLVGATDGFIKVPFLIEGMIQGFFGAVISIVLLYILYLVFLSKMTTLSLMGINPKVMPFLPAGLLLLITVFSTLLGMLGSFLSLGEIISE